MKKKLIYTGLLLFGLSIMATYGQSNAEVPGRTAEEQAAFEKSVQLAPANAGTLIDPKMDPAQVAQVSPTNWKADPLTDKNNISPEENQPEQARVASQPASRTKDHDQPEGVKPKGKTMNHRDMKGQNTQAEAHGSGKAKDYRNLNGTNTQPEGEKPKR